MLTYKLLPTASAVLILLLGASPAHAASISMLDADVNLNYDNGQVLTGNIDFTYNPYFYIPGSSIPYNVSGASLSLNGTPLGASIIGNTGFQGTQTYFPYDSGSQLFDLEVNTSNIGNLTFADFLGATSGTVTVVSETLATPLPGSFPLFATGLLALVGFAAVKRARQSS